MKYNDLTIARSKGSRRSGRGIASGRGKTAGRGTKGQGSRTGSSKRPGFEGGQNPLMQRLPKLRGFKSHRDQVAVVTLAQLNELNVKTVDTAVLADKAVIVSPYSDVKVVASGELKKALTVKLSAASSTAIEAIEKAGGSFERVERAKRPARSGDKQSRKAKKSAKQ